LTHFEAKEFKPVLEGTFCLGPKPPEFNFKIEAKSRIKCTLLTDPDDKNATLKKKNLASLSGTEILIDQLQAMNDITLDSGSSLTLTNMDCYINGKLLTSIRADGYFYKRIKFIIRVIIATASGSTAYNMAAGGSLVHSSIPGILFTPICPFSLSFRPLIFPEDVVIVFKVNSEARAPVLVSVDGHTRFELNKKEGVEIKTSEYPVSYVVNSGGSAVSGWFENVKALLNWNSKTIKRVDSLE